MKVARTTASARVAPPDLKDEELKPDDLVDQRRGAAGDEQREERRSRFHQASRIPSP